MGATPEGLQFRFRCAERCPEGGGRPRYFRCLNAYRFVTWLCAEGLHVDRRDQCLRCGFCRITARFLGAIPHASGSRLRVAVPPPATQLSLETSPRSGPFQTSPEAPTIPLWRHKRALRRPYPRSPSCAAALEPRAVLVPMAQGSTRASKTEDGAKLWSNTALRVGSLGKSAISGQKGRHRGRAFVLAPRAGRWSGEKEGVGIGRGPTSLPPSGQGLCRSCCDSALRWKLGV